MEATVTQTAVPTEAPPFRFFPAEVTRVTRLSPNFVRVTLTGDDLDDADIAGLLDACALTDEELRSMPSPGAASTPHQA